MKSLFKKVGLGTVQLGMDYGISNDTGKPSKSEAGKIFREANANGITTLDTAVAYGDSEKVIGEFASDNFNIISKWINNPQEDLEKSLKKLKKESIFGWLAHRPERFLEFPEEWEMMSAQKEGGKVEKIGFSVNSTEELEKLLDKGFKPSIVQLPYNILDRRFEYLFKPLKDMDCEIHCRSIYLQGLFFMDPNKLDKFFDPIKKWLLALQATSSDNLTYLATLLQVIHKEEVDKVIIGIQNSDQLLELVKALSQKGKEIPALCDFDEQLIIPANWPKKN